MSVSMSAAPARSFTLLAAAILVTAVIISATLFVALGTPATVTKTSTSTQVSTSTLTSTVVSTSTVTTTCIEGSVSLSFEPLLAYNSTTDCQLGITLGLSAIPGIFEGTNQSITVFLANDEPAARNVNYTGFPTLHGLNPSSLAWYDDVLPLQPACGYPTTFSFESAFIVVYNATGFPMQLSDSPMPILGCPITSGAYYHAFTASQKINESISIGGYWISPDAQEPWINATYNQFSPGNYTIVAFDPWGQATELNFTVAPYSSVDTTTTSAECSITGQPGPAFIRVLSDSNQTPVGGALVKATNNPAYCGSETTTSFTTTAGTQWYPLNSENSGGYSFVVTYLGQTYTFTASLRPLSTTCATLYVPSGRTNVTIAEFQTTC